MGKALRAALDAARLTALAMHLGLMGFLLGRHGKALRAALDAARLTALAMHLGLMDFFWEGMVKRCVQPSMPHASPPWPCTWA